MTPEERRQLIKQSHAKKRPALPVEGGPRLTREQVAEVLARVEAAEIAHGQAIFVRRVAEIQAHRRVCPPGSLSRKVPPTLPP